MILNLEVMRDSSKPGFRTARDRCGPSRTLQDDYRTWLDALPANLEGSRLAEKLQAIVELDPDEVQPSDPSRLWPRLT